MKRAQDKIRDFVEPQAFEEVQNFNVDPATALAAYRFTDSTAELIAQWLDALADLPRQRGTARALAGVRGVGKSHTLATFGAIVSLLEKRSTVVDAHVARSIRRLLNRRYVVARVERGTRATLLEELRVAFVKAFDGDESEWKQEPSAMLAIASSLAGDAPLIVLIDTSFGRQTRVDRDDGPVLSELAAATEHVNVFIGLALDDDIAGADGANVAVSDSYHIDYLDPEHLYKIADLHLFKKDALSRAALHDIYTFLRNSVQGFGWSEPRFTSIYPVHPLVADVAPAVRLYAHTFAFLPFAASAVARAANRPALSLIGLDEVFDRAEYELRKAEDLKDAMAVYDSLVANEVTKLPIMQRLEAKLVLKGLMISSLDGHGATAQELCAGMLLFDEKAPEASAERLREMLSRFAEAAPSGAWGQSEDGEETRYRFNIRASAGFSLALTAHAQTVDEAAINDLLRVVARTRFEDWPFFESDAPSSESEDADIQVLWSGTHRHGTLAWKTSEDGWDLPTAIPRSDAVPNTNDLEIIMLAPSAAGNLLIDGGSEAEPGGSNGAAWSPYLVWCPAKLTAEETSCLRRLIALRTSAELSASFGETARAAERTHAALVERIWTRIYMDDGALLLSDGRHDFTEEARGASTLAEMLARMLSPMFAARYPLHPSFAEPLGESEVSRLVSGLFGGANQGSASVQELARVFAMPLGLVLSRADVYTLEAGDHVLSQPWVRDVLTMTDIADGDVVPLDEVYAKLRSEPYGLLKDSQHLILTALVAQRRIELVTAAGDRIGRRTLDLKLNWDDITGIARAATLLHDAEELTEWARLLTRQETLCSIADPAERDAARLALSEWLDGWKNTHLLENYEALPDAGLTTRTWKLAGNARKCFGTAADAVEAALGDIISLEEGLQRVADAFGDSPEQYAKSSEQLIELSSFVNGLASRESVREYLALAEPTTVDEIESARRELLAMIDDQQSPFDQESNKRFDLLWREFHARFSEHYATMHAETVGANSNRRSIDTLTHGGEWSEFEALADLSIVNRQHWEKAAGLLRQAQNSFCDLNVRQVLADRPACVCSFRLARAGDFSSLPNEIAEVLSEGRHSYRKTLSLMSTPLAIALDAIARKDGDGDTSARARSLSGAFARGTDHAQFTKQDVQLIEQALQRMAVPPPVRVRIPSEEFGLLTRDELRQRLNLWLDDLPNQPALVEIVGEVDSSGSEQETGQQ